MKKINVSAHLLLAGVLIVVGCSKKKEEVPAQGGVKISGTLEIAPALVKKTKASDTIFIIARRAEGGPTVAAKRLEGNNYPMSFEITDTDLMSPDVKPDSPLNITVRVDKDGEAMSKKPGDLTGEYEKNPAPLNAEGIIIQINKVME